jgi:DNA-directed RNA polymerase subunit M/transcription elongation factor TFIIS
MPLPNLVKQIPQFDIVIPSTQQPHKFRQFLVREEKLLLVALEDGDDLATQNAVIQIVNNCAVSPIKAEELANFDIEYIFMQLRAKSVDNFATLNYKCHNKVNVNAGTDNAPAWDDCSNIVQIKIDLNDVKVTFPDGHTKQIMLSPTMGVNMRYPNHKMAKFIANQGKSEDIFAAIALCVESVFDEESVYTNFSMKEVEEWLGDLTQQQFIKVQEQFFDTMPVLKHSVVFNCRKCGYQEPIVIEGFSSFFV